MSAKRGSRSARPVASDLFEAGWLPPNAAAEKLGITVKQLEQRAERGEIRRRAIAPKIYLYEVIEAVEIKREYRG